MFSFRTPADLTPNRLSEAVQAFKRSGRTLIDLTAGNPTRAAFEYPADIFRQLADPEALTYSPSPFGMRAAREAVANDYARRGEQVSPDHVTLTASTSEAYSLLFKLLAEAGDEVLVPRPSYPLFDHLARLDLVTAKPYELDIDDGWRIDWESVEAARSPRTRAMLLVSPNNPTGSFVKADEMDRVAALCAAHDMAVIVDEVFADYEVAPGARAAAGRVLERREALSFSLGGLSKSAGLPQAKLAWIATSGPPAIVASALERLEVVCDTYLSVSTPVQVAASDLLVRGAAIRDQIRARIRANDRVLRAQAETTPAIRVLPVEGGWSVVVRVPSLDGEEALVLDLLETDGVLTHPGYFFDFPRESYLVVSLLTPCERFADGIGRVLRHFDCTDGSHE